MFPWGAIIGLAGQAVSGIASAFNNRKIQRAADAEAARRGAYYEAKANEDPLARSENQRILNQYDRDSRQQIENAQGVAAITGKTPEYELAVQKAVAEGRADLMGNMSANSSLRKDYFEQKGEEVAHQKALDDQTRREARNQTYANLAANAANAVGGIIDSYGTKKTAGNNDFVNPQRIESGQGADAAVGALNQKAQMQGVTVSTPPTNLQNEIGKMNAKLLTGVAAPKTLEDVHRRARNIMSGYVK